MGAGHVLELGGTVLDSTSGSAQVEGARITMLTQRKEGGPGLLAALRGTGTLHVPAVIHPRRIRGCRDSST